VKPDGKKAWVYRYKKPDGKWSWLGLGNYPEVSGQLARQKAAELLADSSKGVSLIVAKQQRQQAELEQNNATFEKLIYEFLDTKVTKYTKYTRSTPSTRLVSLNGAIKPVGQVAISLTAVFSATPLQFMQAKQCVF
jgi:hypothetical protein